MAIATRSVTEACESAKRAAHALASADTDTKNRALVRLAELLGERTDEVLEANAAGGARRTTVRPRKASPYRISDSGSRRARALNDATAVFANVLRP